MAVRQTIPRAREFDSSLAFLREGYTFVSSRCDALGSDLFRTRIMMSPVVCMRGAEAAGRFYEGDRFTRKRAMPPHVLWLLQDQGSVQTLDAEEHRHRKRVFLRMLLDPEAIARLARTFRGELNRVVRSDGAHSALSVQDMMQEALARAAALWAGVPFAEEEAAARMRELAAMVENAGSIGPSNWGAILLRQRTERWGKGKIEDIRDGRLSIADDAPAAIIASHRDLGGELLPASIAAVELINILRPTLAVANFITFAALALHEHTRWVEIFREDGHDELRPFAQEVRRYYPFFPVVAGRVRKPFDWSGHHFAARDWVMLDLYGTNHDGRIWEEPGSFRPERFRDWSGDANTLIPQGGGFADTGHRCPGEEITLALIEEAVGFLTRDIRYSVPPQDLDFSLSSLPALPKSRFLMADIAPA
ncbi:cytochrome P450 [Terrihabitans rhizophilus]|uniref:Cytochrome P450 n=1 Tax=Terrihabitans rhizophilus TaxID=3092662 RepID=A0ABU4RRQ5_9HYPH|nr:cytochrome P450 [Terrihabitans sp. PJ23]MDX6806863.1 cytochrome P450 [Terrihabitans sp. PJ23]